MITIHPPYVPVDEVQDLPDEVRAWEPRHTLTDGSVDGMGLVRRTVAGGPAMARRRRLGADRGGPRRGAGREAVMTEGGFRDVKSTKGGELKVTRVVVGRRPPMTTAELPYRTWPSPIDGARCSASGASGSSEPWIEDGATWWLESRPAEDGRSVMVRGPTPGPRPTDVTPEGFNVRTKVHEYGGGSFLVHRGTVVFSDSTDQRLYRQDADGGDPVPITPETGGRHRYADGRVTADGLARDLRARATRGRRRRERARRPPHRRVGARRA